MAAPQVVVDFSGISAPSYEEWLGYVQESYRAIYGEDIYIEADSQDGQLLAILAQGYYDLGSSCVAVYNDFSPATAQGAGLASVVKVNGIRRQVSTNSTAVVTIIGQPGTVISGAIIGDNLNLGTRWSIPPTTIPPDGDTDVTATCVTPGSITASAGTLTDIITPQPGWQTVTNALAAAPGAPVETDAALRRRQSRSAALPADTTLNGIYAAVADVVGVQRAAVYQNDTNVEDGNGIPAHTISVVVEGGTSGDVASAIALKKPPGTPMLGSTVVTVVDSRGVPDTIRYYALRLNTVRSLVYLTALTGYVSSTADLVRDSLAQFYNDQEIGADSYLTRAYAPANLTGESAQLATGLSQAQLDALSRTYHVTVLAQGDEEMVSTGPFPAGSDTIELSYSTDFSVGDVVYIDLDDLSHHRAVVSSVSVGGPGTITFAPVIPIGRSVIGGAQVYLVGDVAMAFNESASATASDTTIEVS